MILTRELVEFAVSEFKLGARQEDGQPLRVHLENLFRQKGVMPKLLEEAPDCPEMGEYLWDWFIEMHADRRSGVNGAERFSAADMLDWCWASGNTLELWERKALRLIDSAWIKAQKDD